METDSHSRVVRPVLLILLLLIGFCPASYAQESDDAPSIDVGLKVAYIGNMGVLIERNKKTVLFDGFHKKYKPDYLFPQEITVTELIKGLYTDFSSIEIALFSHKHGDHYDASYAKLFLDENLDGIVVGPSQIKEEIQKINGNETAQFDNFIKTIPYDEIPHELAHRGIEVSGIQCNHVNLSRHSKIQNMAYLVNMDGFKVLHVGDTNWGLVEAPFKGLQLKFQEIDIAILPYWMLLSKEAEKSITDLINPIKLIATHIPPNFTDSDKKGLLNKFRNAILFTELNQKFLYRKSDN